MHNSFIFFIFTICIIVDENHDRGGNWRIRRRRFLKRDTIFTKDQREIEICRSRIIIIRYIMNNVLRISRVKNSFCDATIPGLIRNGKEKKKEKKTELLYTYIQKKKERQNVCAAMDLFPLYLLSPSGMLRKEMLLLCCVLLFLHSDMIVAHTSLWCLRGKLSWGKFFLEQRLFRRHSSHHFRLITAITI